MHSTGFQILLCQYLIKKYYTVGCSHGLRRTLHLLMASVSPFIVLETPSELKEILKSYISKAAQFIFKKLFEEKKSYQQPQGILNREV